MVPTNKSCFMNKNLPSTFSLPTFDFRYKAQTFFPQALNHRKKCIRPSIYIADD